MSEVSNGDTDVLEEVRSDADRLAQTSIVGERQALAYTLRVLHDFDRQETAEIMETSVSNTDNLKWVAEAHIDDAYDIVAFVGEKTDG